MSDLKASDFVVAPGQAEQSDADMIIVYRSAKLSGHFSIMEGEVRPGELLGFHTHSHEDQHMYIINGELEFEVGGKDGIRFKAGAGSHVLKPRGSSHGFWNLGDETVRYVETSTEGGFEAFVDSRSEGLASMIGGGAETLGMSFETGRSVEVMKEFGLKGLAGANMPPIQELLKDPAFRQMMKEDKDTRELFLYLGGSMFREAVKGLF